MIRLTEKQINDKLKFIKEYQLAKNAASASKVDANANVSCKNIATMSAEINKDINVQINRAMMKEKIAVLFGEDLANEYIRQLENHEIYHHDQSSIPTPYCASVSLYPFLLHGLKTVGGESIAPKNINSFCGSFINLIFALSSQFAGAISTPEFLNIFDYFCRKQFGDDYLETDTKEIEQHLQSVVYALNQPASARSYQSCFWNIAIFDRGYFESLFGEFMFPDGTYASWYSVEKLQKFFMDWFNKERTKALLTFPVITATVLSDGERPVDEKFGDMICEQLANGNSFFIYSSTEVDSLSSCCRLRNELKDNTFSHTLGAGGVATGSVNVITINLNSLVQENREVKTEVEKVHKYQVAYRAIIKDFLDSNLLPVYNAGYISLEKQFSTIGLNGIVEAAESLGLVADNNEAYKTFVSDVLKTVYSANKEASKRYGCMYNTEFVPAENLGIKNAMWDKKKGLKVARDCYNSYFFPVENQAISLVDKFILHGKEMIQYLDGGSALHLNLEEYPTKEGYKKLLGLALKTGCNYFTTNVKITLCNSCEHINKNTTNECSKCGSKDIDWATRVIGYLKRISSFSEPRQKESSKRVYLKV